MKRDFDEKKTIEDSSIIMEKVIAINFISARYNITFPISCKKTDSFLNAGKKLFDEYSKNLYYIANG